MKTLIQILGPTGTGKSKMAVLIAKRFNCEVISADSVQVYRGFDIGTDKIPIIKRGNIDHYLIDILDATETFNVKKFIDISYKASEKIIKKGKIPLTCGGTALYLRAMIKGIFPEKDIRRISREKLKKIASNLGYKRMWERLRLVDPDYADKIGINDKIRIIRGLEIYYNNSIAPSRLFKLTVSPFNEYEFIRIGLKMDRRKLYSLINMRVDQMIDNGLIEETRALMAKYPISVHPFTSIGYSEVIDFLNGKIKREECIDLIKQHSRNYAKRQMTWFYKEQDITWFPPDKPEEIINFLESRIEYTN